MLLKHLVDSYRHCPIAFSSRSVADNERKLHKDFHACTGDKCINQDCSKALFTVWFTSSIAPQLVLVWLLSNTRHTATNAIVLYCAVLNCEGGRAVARISRDVTIYMYTRFQSLFPLYYLWCYGASGTRS